MLFGRRKKKAEKEARILDIERIIIEMEEPIPERCDDEYLVEESYRVCISDGKYYLQDILSPDAVIAIIEKIIYEFKEFIQLPPHIRLRFRAYGRLTPFIFDPNLYDIHVREGEYLQVEHIKYGRLIVPLKLSGEEIRSIIHNVSSRMGYPVSETEPLVSFIDRDLGIRFTAGYPSPTTGEKGIIDIRKQPENPYSFVDLILNDTIDIDQATLAWFSIYYRVPILIIGGMKTGKTTLLTSLMPMVPPLSRVLTIEDAPELKLPPHVEHVQTVPFFQTYFDILKWALRASVDYIIIGEIRGEEAKEWAQAINVGHGGLTTFHASDPSTAIRRLINPPIEIHIENLKAIGLIYHVVYTGRRRFVHTFGLTDKIEPKPLSIENMFSFPQYQNVLSTYGLSEKEGRQIVEEMRRIIMDAIDKGIRDFNKVGNYIYSLLSTR